MTRSALTRLAFIYRQLYQASKPITASQLAAKYEVSIKSVYRDVETLRQMGYEIISNSDGLSQNGFLLVQPCACPFCGRVQGMR